MMAVGRPPSLYQGRIFFSGITKAFWYHRHSQWFSFYNKSGGRMCRPPLCCPLQPLFPLEADVLAKKAQKLVSPSWHATDSSDQRSRFSYMSIVCRECSEVSERERTAILFRLYCVRAKWDVCGGRRAVVVSNSNLSAYIHQRAQFNWDLF